MVVGVAEAQRGEENRGKRRGKVGGRRWGVVVRDEEAMKEKQKPAGTFLVFFFFRLKWGFYFGFVSV